MAVEAQVSLLGAPRRVALEAEGLRLEQDLADGSRRVVFRFRLPREEIRGWISVAGGDD
ncbi:MAG: hypothetical protein R3F11_02890 [Verrucomicrobiales bacterium]